MTGCLHLMQLYRKEIVLEENIDINMLNVEIKSIFEK